MKEIRDHFYVKVKSKKKKQFMLDNVPGLTGCDDYVMFFYNHNPMFVSKKEIPYVCPKMKFKDFKRKYLDLDIYKDEAEAAAEAIKRFAHWEAMPEGDEYWRDVHSKLMEYSQ